MATPFSPTREDVDRYRRLRMLGTELTQEITDTIPSKVWEETAKAIGITCGAAIDREPEYATAFAWLAYWHVMRVGQGWSPDRAIDTERAEQLVARAIESDPREAMAYAVQGHVAGYLRRDLDRAFESFRTALEINHNSARAWLWSSNAHGWTGDGAHAVENIDRLRGVLSSMY